MQVNCFFNSEIFYSFVIKITMLSQCKNIARIRLKSFKFTHATNIDLQNITLAIFQNWTISLVKTLNSRTYRH
ncbi:Uncharacterised protein [Escherichia coli]|uniref:Uncharacterized protein n=1 Tax=Escherichia coli TaxID=562 RepID=A0A377A447_ECOLX|nr:Uncharacterised protein [Escherichia coli]